MNCTEIGARRVEHGVPRVPWAVPISCPLPNVADHVVQAVTVRRKASDRRAAGVAILLRVEHREEPLPGVGYGRPLGIESTREVVLSLAAAARCEFPLRL